LVGDPVDEFGEQVSGIQVEFAADGNYLMSP
jgi:hypothetical protein